MFKKYLQVIKNTWGEYSIYRVNFVMWRARVFLQLIAVYFLWLAIFAKKGTILGYNQSGILTYILLASIVASIVLSSRTIDVADEINRGNLSLFLLKPISYFKYWFSRDLADKVLNIFFSIFEISLILWLLKPPLFIQTNPAILLTFLFASFLGLLLYFFINLLLGFLAFWTTETWAPRFIFITILQFLAGNIFPLDILPKAFYTVLKFTPFPYFLYSPLQIYLGRASINEILTNFLISIVWIFLLYYIVLSVWKLGLKSYAAVGR